MSNQVKRKKRKKQHNKNKFSLSFFRKPAVSSWWKRNWIYPASFLFTVIVLTALYVMRHVHPFGDRAYLRMDFYHQYAPFLKEFYDRVHSGKSLLFSWQNGMGLNFLAIYAYYLASPFNWLILLWPRDGIIEAANFYAVLKGGLASLCFTYFLSHKFRTRSYYVPLFGCIYGLSGFYLAYSCNIIWMDVFFLAPLVLWGVERIAKGKGVEFYLISMAVCAFSNFYMAFILGICSVFYFILNLIEKRHQSFGSILKAVGKYCFATLAAIMTAGIILLPAALAIRGTPSGDAEFPAKWESYFHWYEMLVRFAMNSESIQNNSDLPNIYCSVLCIFLVPLYLCNSRIRLRKKISYSLVCIFLLFSFEWNILDYIWHGLHFPNSFPARQSFFLIFLLIVMGFETFQKRKGIPKPAILLVSILEVGVFIAAYCFLGKDGGKEALSIYLCTVIWIGLYGMLLLLERSFKKIIFIVLFCVLLLSELMINTFVTGIKTTVSRQAYIQKDAITSELLSYLEEHDKSGFYRIEEMDRKAVNDAAWDGYNSISCFSSTIPAGVKELDEAFGHRTSNVSYSFQGATPLTTALYGVKYVFADKEYNLGENYEQSIVPLKSGSVYLYENKNALPLGFVVDRGLEAEMESIQKGNPFQAQNEFTKAVMENPSADLYILLPKRITNFEDEDILSAGAESTQTMNSAKPVQVMVPADVHAFLYVTSYVDEVKVTTFRGQETEGTSEKYDDLKFKRIIDLGISEEERVLVLESDAARNSLNFQAAIMMQNVLDGVVERLGREPFEVTEASEREIKGKVSGNGGVLFTSIPYDKGWKVKMDGETVETNPFHEAFLSFDVTEGEHEIKMKYTPPGLYQGIGMSLIGLAIIAALLYRKKKGSKRKKES